MADAKALPSQRSISADLVGSNLPASDDSDFARERAGEPKTPLWTRVMQEKGRAALRRPR